MSDQEWNCDKCAWNTEMIPIWERSDRFPLGDPCHKCFSYSILCPKDEFKKEHDKIRLNKRINGLRENITLAELSIKYCQEEYFENWGEEL